MKRILIILLFLAGSTICRAQSFFKVETDFPCPNCGPYSIDVNTLQTYTEAEAKTIFNEIATSGMTFTYPQGGCQQRGEMMHLLLQYKFHISHAKIWLFAPKDLDANSKVSLKIKDPNRYAAGDTIDWSYHVAPCIRVKTEAGATVTMVIDPALDYTAPLTLPQWFSKMKNANVSKYTFLDPKWYFFNTRDGNVLNGYFYEYAGINGQIAMVYDQLVMERELAINDVAIFLKKKLDAGAPDPNGAFKKLLSDVSLLINFYTPQERDKISIKPLFMRQFFSDNPDLMLESMKFFDERLLYWSRLIKQLKS